MSDEDGPLYVGDILHGYAGGVFGRDHYDCARIEAIGADWVVARNISGGEPVTATGTDTHRWCRKARTYYLYERHTCDEEEVE